MIQRYEVGMDDESHMKRVKNMYGDYVLYTDHVEAVKQARKDAFDIACTMIKIGAELGTPSIKISESIRQAAEKD